MAREIRAVVSEAAAIAEAGVVIASRMRLVSSRRRPRLFTLRRLMVREKLKRLRLQAKALRAPIAGAGGVGVVDVAVDVEMRRVEAPSSRREQTPSSMRRATRMMFTRSMRPTMKYMRTASILKRRGVR
ncbi:hypothetical protein GCM10011507_32550 [Edaphobacter acidisoli]|uniref:Uncharacterized protein n=1 Tax=Edaphobacter acidisoli TaxID=2040573 RepID=A0A916S2R0_9BACT|nr:hypothetical protein GCM10011507_32550 [Edaphobacter acidisoli]